MSSREHFSDRLHQGISHNHSNITSRVPLGLLSEVGEVGGCETVRRGANVDFEHPTTGLNVGERNVYSLLEPLIDRRSGT